ncbi:MAG TPA: D-alanyl-D-alanine dipeptidase [Chlamydiales bacterium]|nr:D-alanyl-D-alanine dipeptidase [Chlamydiales bacterium]
MNRIVSILFLIFGSLVFAEHPLVDVQTINSNILVELRYATKNNFTGEVIYDFDKCYLQIEVAQALSKVERELESMGLRLKIWDGYRPRRAQQKLWDIIQDERYVSNPQNGGRHTRGTAVDLTIVYKNGQEIAMPTDFDDFSERAHRSYMDLPHEVLDNRSLLELVMLENGFVGAGTEWWHFDYDGWENFDEVEMEPN